MVKPITIPDRSIGPGSPCFIIAEAGVNHNGDLEKARELVRVAARSGADAVKFQTFRTDSLVTADAPKADYQTTNTGSKGSQREMLKQLELNEPAFRELAKLSAHEGILFLSTPFDRESAVFLNELGMPLFKVPSGELTHHEFLVFLAAMGKPLIISTGMASLTETSDALSSIRNSTDVPLALLHCISNYPASPAEANLRAMDTLAQEFGVPVGYSDHTEGIEIAVASVAAGACILEKHFTLDRNLPGPDHKASLEPNELLDMVMRVRLVEKALGHGRKEPSVAELGVAKAARRSLVAAMDIEAGLLLEEWMLEARRPGTGLPPSRKHALLGRRLRVRVAAGTLMREEFLQ